MLIQPCCGQVGLMHCSIILLEKELSFLIVLQKRQKIILEDSDVFNAIHSAGWKGRDKVPEDQNAPHTRGLPSPKLRFEKYISKLFVLKNTNNLLRLLHTNKLFLRFDRKRCETTKRYGVSIVMKRTVYQLNFAASQHACSF